jgi:hypothetical protein
LFARLKTHQTQCKSASLCRGIFCCPTIGKLFTASADCNVEGVRCSLAVSSTLVEICGRVPLVRPGGFPLSGSLFCGSSSFGGERGAKNVNDPPDRRRDHQLRQTINQYCKMAAQAEGEAASCNDPIQREQYLALLLWQNGDRASGHAPRPTVQPNRVSAPGGRF